MTVWYPYTALHAVQAKRCNTTRCFVLASLRDVDVPSQHNDGSATTTVQGKWGRFVTRYLALSYGLAICLCLIGRYVPMSSPPIRPLFDGVGLVLQLS